MTTITFGMGYVGFAFECIDQSHRWVPGVYQLMTNAISERNTLTNEYDKRSRWPDHRNLRWFWSPDGKTENRVYCETLDRAMNLVTSTWYLEPPTAIKHAPEYNGYIIVWGDLDSGIAEITGPFPTSSDASDYAERVAANEGWITLPVTGPLVQYVKQ